MAMQIDEPAHARVIQANSGWKSRRFARSLKASPAFRQDALDILPTACSIAAAIDGLMRSRASVEARCDQHLDPINA